MLSLPALTRVSVVALSGVLLTPAPALAADGEQTPLGLDGAAEKAPEAVGASGGSIVRTIVGLLVVIAVIYGLTWILKQVKANRQPSTDGAGLAPLATLTLGQNRALHLVRAGDEVVLVGSGEHGVTPIRVYTQEEARVRGLLAPEDGAVAGSAMTAVEPAVFGAETRRGRFIDELRKRTVIK